MLIRAQQVNVEKLTLGTADGVVLFYRLAARYSRGCANNLGGSFPGGSAVQEENVES